jgi:3-oxoacyl-[acyl-carrier protein] reductase
MRRQGAGIIIITSSVAGPEVSMPGSGAYAVSKAAVTGFIHTAAIELAADSITVNAIEPGYIDTPGASGLKARVGAERLFPFHPCQTSRPPRGNCRTDGVPRER